MTDNEITKALECLSGKLMFCGDCKYSARFHYGECQQAAAMDVLDLINRLKAENSNLSSDLTSLKKDLTSAKAEIERLKKENLELEIEKFKCNTKVGTLTGRITLMERDIPFIKAEAIKDFAEIIVSDYPEMEYYLDNLVKEMIGEQVWVH